MGSQDGKPHHIRFYSDVSSTWLGVGRRDDISWDLKKNSATANATGATPGASEDIFTWLQRRRQQLVFGEDREFPQWGDVAYSTSLSGDGSVSFECGEATAVRLAFFQNHTLNNDVVSFTTDFGDHTPVFAFAHDSGVVNEASVRYTIGSVQDPIVQYITDEGLTRLKPWWSKCYGDLNAMIRFHWEDYDTVQMIGTEFEMQLQADVNHFYEGTEELASNGPAWGSQPIPGSGTDQYGQQFVFNGASDYGFLDPSNWTGIAPPYVSEAQSYYSIVALSARQIMGAYVFAQGPNASSQDPLVFQKEISSNGNVNTVDVLYPAAPFFLYANPNLLRYALQPLYEYQERQFYPNGYCIHDLGTHFPNATGHVEGTDEYMPVEESANLILMSYAYYKFTGDADWLTSHYGLLRQFTHYLIDFSLVPEAQLSTDDFAGALLNQTNLAIKGIVGLQAMSYIANLANNATDATDYANTAKSYYDQWEVLGIDPSHKHTTLAYQWRSSWGLLYNIVSGSYIVLINIHGNLLTLSVSVLRQATQHGPDQRNCVYNAVQLVSAGVTGLRRPPGQPPPLHQDRLADLGGRDVPRGDSAIIRRLNCVLAQQHGHQRPIWRSVRMHRPRGLRRERRVQGSASGWGTFCAPDAWEDGPAG